VSRRLLRRPASGPRRASTSPECSRPVAGSTFSYSGVTMRIRRLARNAAFIAVAAMVMGGFATGVAGATSVAPASTVSAVTSVTSGGTAPRMLPGCTPQPQFCTYASSIRGLVLLQKFGCAIGRIHSAVDGNIIFEMVNGCAVRVYYYYTSGGDGCINHNSSRARTGDFAPIRSFYVSAFPNC
jgi:hypothetical protein